MISYLQWKILDPQLGSCTLLTHSGIGYEVLINELTFSKLQSLEDAWLYIYHHITENSQMLFWFTELTEKEVFKELIKISWVGGKVALSILSLGREKLVQAVSLSDNKTIEWIKWIGKKMAEKIILELKDKDFITESVVISGESQWWAYLDGNLKVSIQSTLVSMWYLWSDVERVLSVLPEWMNDTGEIMAYVIRELG